MRDSSIKNDLFLEIYVCKYLVCLNKYDFFVTGTQPFVTFILCVPLSHFVASCCKCAIIVKGKKI